MSKDFEQAYRELAKNECPDLWNRIEAGLREKNTPKTSGIEERTFTTVLQKDIYQKTSEGKDGQQEIPEAFETGKSADGKRKRAVPARKYVGVAAAVICAAIVIPAWLGSGFGKKSFSASGGAYEETSEESCDTAETESAAAPEDVLENESEGEEPLEAAGIEEESGKMAEWEEASESLADSGGGLKAEDATVTGSRTDADNSAVAESGAADEAAIMESETEDSEDGATEKKTAQKKDSATPSDDEVLHMVVAVTGAEHSYEDGTQAGTLFTADIREDQSGFFREGEQIEIYVPVYSSQMLAVDGVFNVNIVYKSSETHPYVLQSSHWVLEE